MSWAVRAATNSLASPDNLARWKKVVDPKCPLCSISPCTLGHILSNCQEALDRYEWRHNNIVKYLVSTFSASRREGVEIYADLEGHRVNGVTIPPDIAVTGQKPDLVIIDRKASPPEVRLIELTVPWDTQASIENALNRKMERYSNVCNDIKQNGLKCFIIPLEIGTRGYINNRNKGTLVHLSHIMNHKKISDITKKCSKLALLGSYTIWNARHSNDWTSENYLQP